jgi:hypothetical protein
MPPADAAPDPLDRPAAALAAELSAWCAEGSPPTAGAWLPALPFGEWFNWQRDLARRLAAAVLAADREQPDAGGATMTAEDLSEVVVRHLRDVGCVIIPGAADVLAPILAAIVNKAEVVAAARQREADAAACRAVLEFWDRDSPAPGPYEAGAVAAAEMCVERIMEGCPDAGGGGAGGGATE